MAWLGAALALPLAYAGSLAAVIVHEALGHGVTAAALGGRFAGLRVRLDLMGYASVTSPPGARVAVLAGGIVSTTLVGALLVLFSRRAKDPVAGLVLAVLAIAFLQEGPPYAVWNAAIGEGGDVGRILGIIGRGARAWLLPLAVLVYVAGTWAGHAALFRRAEDLLGPLSRGAAWSVAGGVALVVFAGSVAFDWKALLGTTTPWPATGALALGLAVAAVLVGRRRREMARVDVSAGRWVLAVTAAWIVTALLSMAVALWLADGLPEPSSHAAGAAGLRSPRSPPTIHESETSVRVEVAVQ